MRLLNYRKDRTSFVNQVRLAGLLVNTLSARPNAFPLKWVFGPLGRAQITMTPIRDRSGRLLQILGVQKDVSCEKTVLTLSGEGMIREVRLQQRHSFRRLSLRLLRGWCWRQG
eukprot:SAG11_NODE_3738_length_2257_cov_1.570436_3_plen_112_part_01